MIKPARKSKKPKRETLWAMGLIDAAESTVLMVDPSDSTKLIVGLKIDKAKRPCARLITAFDAIIDLAQEAALRYRSVERKENRRDVNTTTNSLNS